MAPFKEDKFGYKMSPKNFFTKLETNEGKGLYSFVHYGIFKIKIYSSLGLGEAST